MLIFATGRITRPDQIGPLMDEETRVLDELRAEGLVRSAYRKIPGPGVVSVLEANSIEDAAARMSRLPFVARGLMTFDYTEIVDL